MTWGILAYLATTPRARRYLSAASAIVSLGVGLTTVYLGTHWLSDVLLGWTAGLLILLSLPWVEPLITRAEAWIFAQREALRGRGRPVPSVPVAACGPRTVVLPQPVGATAETPVLEPVAAGGHPATTTGTVAGARSRAHPAAPSHLVRSERTPVTPAGSRRPPHADRTPRGGTAPARPMSGG